MTRRMWQGLWLLAALSLVCLGQYYRLYLWQFPVDALIFFGAGCVLFARLLTKSRVPVPESVETAPPPAEVRPRVWLLALSVALAAGAWEQSAHNTFTLIGVIAWWSAVLTFVAAFWTWAPIRLRLPISREGILWHMDWYTLAVIGLIALAIFFRFYRLDAAPPEINSDHVEKLYDVYDVLNGLHPIYFERNTGREPMQFYMAIVIIKLFNTGVTHYTLKLTNAVIGIVSILGVYLLGREIGGKRLGLLAGFFAAVSIWPVATSRIGLRYPFAPAFTSLALWSLLRALRTNRRNVWLVAGVILGAGLYGYTAFRLMPVAAVALIGLHALAHWKKLLAEFPRWAAQVALYVAAATLVFLPLGHYMLQEPQMFWYRSLTRAGNAERAVTGNPLLIFSVTFSRTLGMFNWLGDEVWVCTIPKVPALDVISGGLLLLGLVYALVYLGRRRGLLTAQLIVCGAILLLPSALNLAFPGESPSVVRASGAMPVVAILIGLALYHLAGEMQANLSGQNGRVVTAVLVTMLLLGMVAFNYQRYFVSYLAGYRTSAMNTREVSDAVRNYISANGSDFDHVYLKGWPHWLDARALALQVDQKPGWENTHVTLEAKSVLSISSDKSAPRLYIVHPADTETLQLLRTQFPDGQALVNHSATPGHDFIFFSVPGLR